MVSEAQTASAAETGNGDRQSPTSAWPVGRRIWVSLILLVHLLAIGIAPLAVVDPRSDLAMAAHQVAAPWSRSLFLDHGYRFFAPEPGPAHIVHYTVTRADGTTVEGQFPDQNRHWPRLLYHRWFMLSETMYQFVSRTIDNDELQQWQEDVEGEIRNLVEAGNPRAAEQLELAYRQDRYDHDRTRDLLNMLADAVGEELVRRHHGTSVSMKMVTRLIPVPEDILAGQRLNDPQYTPADLQTGLGSAVDDRTELETLSPEGPDQPRDPAGQGGGP